MRRFVSGVVAFVLPGGLVLLAAVGFLRPRGLPDFLQPPIAAIPYIVLVFGLVFGWYLSSTRLVLSLLVLSLAERAVTIFPMTDQDPGSTGQKIFAITAFLLPLNLLAFSLVKPETRSGMGSVVRLLPVCVQPFVALWLCYPDQQYLVACFSRAYMEWLPTGWTPVPQLALAAFLLAAGMHLTQFLLKRDPIEAGSFWALAAAFVAYHGTQSGWQPTNFFSAGGFILFLAVVQSTHQQTYRDELTGIAGRQAYDEAIHRLGFRYAFAVLAVDQLKSYASVHGRSVGEQVFKLIAPLVQSACRGAKVYRVSGEELIVMFAGCSAVETLPTLETVRKTVEATSLLLCGHDRVREKGKWKISDNERELPVTISGGVAEPAGEFKTLDSVQRAAYRALYEAKSAGGNIIKRGSARAEDARRSYGNQGRIVASGEH